MGLEALKSRRDRAKLKFWYKVCRLPDNTYPKQLLSQEWDFQEALKQLLGARYAEFETLSAVEKTSYYVLGSENWEDDFDALLHLVKEFIVAVWEV